MEPSLHAASATSSVVTRSRSRALQRPQDSFGLRHESSSEREDSTDCNMEVETRRRRSSSTKNRLEEESSKYDEPSGDDPMESSPTKHVYPHSLPAAT